MTLDLTDYEQKQLEQIAKHYGLPPDDALRMLIRDEANALTLAQRLGHGTIRRAKPRLAKALAREDTEIANARAGRPTKRKNKK